MYNTQPKNKGYGGAKPAYGLQRIVQDNPYFGGGSRTINPLEKKSRAYMPQSEKSLQQRYFGRLNPLESLVFGYHNGLVDKGDIDFVMKATVASYLIDLLPREMQKPMYHGLSKMIMGYLAQRTGKTKGPSKKGQYRS